MASVAGNLATPKRLPSAAKGLPTALREGEGELIEIQNFIKPPLGGLGVKRTFSTAPLLCFAVNGF
jgi:hypothetical protein